MLQKIAKRRGFDKTTAVHWEGFHENFSKNRFFKGWLLLVQFYVNSLFPTCYQNPTFHNCNCIGGILVRRILKRFCLVFVLPNFLFGTEIRMSQIIPEGWLVGFWDGKNWDWSHQCWTLFHHNPTRRCSHRFYIHLWRSFWAPNIDNYLYRLLWLLQGEGGTVPSWEKFAHET